MSNNLGRTDENIEKHVVRTNFFEGGGAKRLAMAAASNNCGCPCSASCPCVCEPNCGCIVIDDPSAALTLGSYLASLLSTTNGLTNTAVNAVTTPNYNGNRNADTSAQSAG